MKPLYLLKTCENALEDKNNSNAKTRLFHLLAGIANVALSIENNKTVHTIDIFNYHISLYIELK